MYNRALYKLTHVQTVVNHDAGQDKTEILTLWFLTVFTRARLHTHALPNVRKPVTKIGYILYYIPSHPVECDLDYMRKQ